MGAAEAGSGLALAPVSWIPSIPVESTASWRRDAAERRAATAEETGEGEDEPGLGEDKFRRRFAHLFRSTGAA
jgi:hypothetical protein